MKAVGGTVHMEWFFKCIALEGILSVFLRNGSVLSLGRGN